MYSRTLRSLGAAIVLILFTADAAWAAPGGLVAVGAERDRFDGQSRIYFNPWVVRLGHLRGTAQPDVSGVSCNSVQLGKRYSIQRGRQPDLDIGYRQQRKRSGDSWFRK
jgi:hypothetical protein